MAKRVWVAVAAAAVLAGCGAPPVSGTTPFVAAEHERCLDEGRGRLVGRASLRVGGGPDQPAAWDEVTLWPATPYSRALAAELAAGLRPAPEGRLAPYARVARTDAAGRFAFENLPSCRYVALLAVPGSLAGLRAGTGYAAAEAEVADGRTATVALAWPPAVPPAAAPPAPPGAEAGPAPVPPRRKPSRTGDAPADPCAPYALDPVKRLRCEWVTGPERDRFVLPAGRGASLRTRMDCIPDRDDPERYAACVARGS